MLKVKAKAVDFEEGKFQVDCSMEGSAPQLLCELVTIVEGVMSEILAPMPVETRKRTLKAVADELEESFDKLHDEFCGDDDEDEEENPLRAKTKELIAEYEKTLPKEVVEATSQFAEVMARMLMENMEKKNDNN